MAGNSSKKRWLATRPMIALSCATLAGACKLDDRRFDSEGVPSTGGSPSSREELDAAADPQSPGRDRPTPETMSEPAAPGAVTGASAGCDDAGGCPCETESESCAPVPLCADGGATCEATCPGCLIAGECVGPQAVNPENPCQICEPSADALGWSNRDGAACDDTLFCTTEDVCNGGRCAGTPRECEDGVACNGVSTCVEESDSCSSDVNQCANGTVCSVAARACVSTCTGCLISGICIETDGEEAGNPCRVCDPARSIDSFSPAVGKACGAAASACSQRDTCNAQGVCQPNDLPAGTPCGDSDSSACDESDACDGSGVCRPRLAANGVTCNDGQFCTATDRCQGGACIGSGSACIANQTCNETTNQCVCAGGTLSCNSALGGSPNCSSWDFESNGSEGWELDLATAGSSDAHEGTLVSSIAVPAPRGNRSLAVRFRGTGSPDRTMLFIRVPLCAGGSSVDISGRQLQALVRLVSDPGTNPLSTQQGHLVSLYSGASEFPFAGGDFSVDPATGGGVGPLGWHVVDVNISEQFGDQAANALALGFRFLVDTVWSGTIYIDDIRLL